MKHQLLVCLFTIGVALGGFLANIGHAGPGRGMLFGTDTGNGDLVVVDLTTGRGTVVGNTGVSSVPSLAVDPTTGIIYLGQGGGSPNLYTVDPIAGIATLVGDSGLGFSAISGMNFSSDGTLYAAVNIVGDGGTGGDHLATIDKTTGQATIIGPFGTCGGSCDLEGIGGIASDTSGNLWAVHRGRGAPGEPGLYRVSVLSGHASFVTPIEDRDGNPPPGGVTSIQFGCDGTLYGGTNEGRLITINPPNGRFEFVDIDKSAVARALGGLAFQDSCLALDHFVCYRIERAKSQVQREVVIENQFGKQTFLVKDAQMLCVPSSKTQLK